MPASDRIAARVEWEPNGTPHLRLDLLFPSHEVFEWLREPQSGPPRLVVTASLQRDGRDVGGNAWVLETATLRDELETTPALMRSYTLPLAPGVQHLTVQCLARGRNVQPDWQRDLEVPTPGTTLLLVAEPQLSRVDGGLPTSLARTFDAGTGRLRVDTAVVDGAKTDTDSLELTYEVVSREPSPSPGWRRERQGLQAAGAVTPWRFEFDMPPPGAYALAVTARRGDRWATMESSFLIGISDLSSWEAVAGSLELLELLLPEEDRLRLQEAPADEQPRLWTAYWQAQDPDPSTPANECRDELERRLRYANQSFGGTRPGWRSDRGRVYIRMGAPDQIDALPTTGRDRMERWTYPGGQVFVFRDADGSGDFVLLRRSATGP